MGTTISGGHYLDKSGKAHDANGNPIGVAVAEVTAPIVNTSASAIFTETAKKLKADKK